MASAILSAGRQLVRVLDILAALIVARFLAPEDFGIVALAAAALGVARGMTELPVGEALVRSPELTRADMDTAFALTVLRGLLIAGVLALAGWPMAAFYGDDRLIALTCALAIAPLAQGFRNPRLVEFERAVNYAPTTIIDCGAKVVSFLAAILFAYFTQSYWALVIALVVPPLLATPASFLFAPYLPRFDMSRTRSIISYAGWVTVSRFLATANGEADRFFVGGILGTSSVAFWAMGRSLAYSVGWSIGVPLMPALFSGFARVQHDHERFVNAFLKGQAMIFACLVPVGFAAGLLAEPIVSLALGPQWQPVVPIIQYLAPAGALVGVALPVQSTMLALNRPRQLVRRDAIMFAIGIPALVLGAWWGGLMGAVYARTLTAIVDAFINMSMLKDALGISVKRQMLNPWRSAVSVLVMCATMLAALATMPGQEGMWHDIVTLVSVGSIGVLAYLLAHVVLWTLSGRPAGPEQVALKFASDTLGRFHRKVEMR